MRGQKGITLVALVITIVVLLILALVAVNSMSETNIINYTKNGSISNPNIEDVLDVERANDIKKKTYNKFIQER